MTLRTISSTALIPSVMLLLGTWAGGCSQGEPPVRSTTNGSAPASDADPADVPRNSPGSSQVPPVQPPPRQGRAVAGARDLAQRRPGGRMPSFKFHVNGIRRPVSLDAEETNVSDGTLVIGVRLGMLARAYVVSAFEAKNVKFPIARDGTAMIDSQDAAVLSRHVVNDVLDGHPVTVTYCNLHQCARVLTREGSRTPLDVGVGGWNDGLLLLIDGKRVPQKASNMPLEDVPFEVTTWKEWREHNPETDVYVGG